MKGASHTISLSEALDIGERLGVNWKRINLVQFRRGLEVEMEHKETVGGDIRTIANIAIDHLREIPDYYTRLDRMEEQAKRAGHARRNESEVETLKDQLAHAYDDFEKVAGLARKCLREQTALLEAGLTALSRTPPKIRVMVDHAQRAIAAMGDTLRKIDKLSGA